MTAIKRRKATQHQPEEKSAMISMCTFFLGVGGGGVAMLRMWLGGVAVHAVPGGDRLLHRTFVHVIVSIHAVPGGDRLLHRTFMHF